MSNDFFDQSGNPYAYSDDGIAIYAFDGTPIAYVDDDSIYSYDGRHVGYFHSGAILDGDGHTLLFTDGATGGPMKPMRLMKPLKSLKQMLPMKGMKQMKPMKPMFTLGWSQLMPKTIFGV